MNLYTALLLPSLGMPSNAFKYKIGKEAYGGGIYNLQPVHPFGMLTFAAVRYKLVSVTSIQITIYVLELLVSDKSFFV